MRKIEFGYRESLKTAVITRREAPRKSRVVGNDETWIASPLARNDDIFHLPHHYDQRATGTVAPTETGMTITFHHPRHCEARSAAAIQNFELTVVSEPPPHWKQPSLRDVDCFAFGSQ